MGNFINDLNKMVNTIQKVDKFLTEKPKRKRINRISVSLTEEELRKITYWFRSAEEQITHHNFNSGLITQSEIDDHNKLYAKLRNQIYLIQQKSK